MARPTSGFSPAQRNARLRHARRAGNEAGSGRRLGGCYRLRRRRFLGGRWGRRSGPRTRRRPRRFRLPPRRRQVKPIEIQPAQLDRPLGRISPGRRLNRIVEVMIAVGRERVFPLLGFQGLCGATQASPPDRSVLMVERAEQLGVIRVRGMERGELARLKNNATKIVRQSRRGPRAKHWMRMSGAVHHHLRHRPLRRLAFPSRLAKNAHRQQHRRLLLGEGLVGIGDRNRPVAPGWTLIGRTGRRDGGGNGRLVFAALRLVAASPVRHTSRVSTPPKPDARKLCRKYRRNRI